MSTSDDNELLDRFHRRLARVTGEVKAPPAGLAPVRGSMRVAGGGIVTGRALAGSAALIVMAIVAIAFVPTIIGRPAASTRPALVASGASVSTAASAARDGAVLSLSAEGDVSCASEGGCAAYVDLRPIGAAGPVAGQWPVSSALYGLAVAAGAPKALPPGRYQVEAHLNRRSDVRANGQPAAIAGVVASCRTDLVVGPAITWVGVTVTFHGADPCRIVPVMYMASSRPTSMEVVIVAPPASGSTSGAAGAAVSFPPTVTLRVSTSDGHAYGEWTSAEGLRPSKWRFDAFGEPFTVSVTQEAATAGPGPTFAAGSPSPDCSGDVMLAAGATTTVTVAVHRDGRCTIGSRSAAP